MLKAVTTNLQVHIYYGYFSGVGVGKPGSSGVAVNVGKAGSGVGVSVLITPIVGLIIGVAVGVAVAFVV